jgi:hypothetical protein
MHGLKCILHLPEDGHMSGRNMQEMYGVYNILPYTCASVGFDIVSNCWMHGYGSFKIVYKKISWNADDVKYEVGR